MPILSGLGAIQLAQEPDGILALAGQQKLRKKREKRGWRSIAAAEAEIHGGDVPEHERPHATPPPATPSGGRRRCAGSALSTTRCAAAFAVRGIVAGYGDVEVLHGVDLQVAARARSSRCSAPTAPASRRSARSPRASSTPSIGHRATSTAPTSPTTEPFRRARAGVLLVPEARGIFPGLTVEENLTVLLRDDELRAKALRALPDPVANAASRWPACCRAASSRC